MTILFGPFLCTALLAQMPADRTITGEVVDGRGKAVADVQVVLYAPPALYGSTDPVELRAKSDALGSFAIKVPPLGVAKSFRNWANVLAYRPGSAIGAVLVSGPPPFRLVLQDVQPRTVRIEGHDGEPIVGREWLCEGSTSSAARLRKSLTRWPIRSPSAPGRTGRPRSAMWPCATSLLPSASRPTRSARKTFCSSSNLVEARSRE